MCTLLKLVWLQITLPIFAAAQAKDRILHVNETTYIDLGELFDSNSIKPSSQFSAIVDGNKTASGVSFTHGGATTSRLIDVSQNSTCTGYMLSGGTNSIGLVCQNRAFLLDLNTYSRSQSLRLDMQPSDKNISRQFTSFATSSYSMILLSATNQTTDSPSNQTTDSPSNQTTNCIDAYYINTFDSSYKYYNCSERNVTNEKEWLPNQKNIKFVLNPTVKYVFMNSLKYIVTFDSYKRGSDVPVRNASLSSFFVRRSDASGGPANVNTLKHELFEDDKKPGFFDIFNVSYHIVFLYTLEDDKTLMIKASKNLESISTEKFDITGITILILVNPVWLPESEQNNTWKGQRDSYIARHITGDYIMIFYSKTFELVVCRINFEIKSIEHCNEKPLNLSNNIEDTTNLDVFGVSAAKPHKPGENMSFFLEIKRKDTENTEMSFAIVKAVNATYSLHVENEWRIPGNLHIMNYADETVKVLRGKTMETYPVVMKYVRINVSKYFNQSSSNQNSIAKTNSENSGKLGDASYSILMFNSIWEKNEWEDKKNKTTPQKSENETTPQKSENETTPKEEKINATIINDYKNFLWKAPKNSSLTKPKGSTSVIFYETNAEIGNNFSVSTSDDSIYISRIVTNPKFKLDPEFMTNETIIKVAFEGEFLIAVSKTEDEKRTMYVYKCINQELMKFYDNGDSPERMPGYQRSMECKKLKEVEVNPLVDLVDAQDLKDFLVVRFKSQNSVVYYKFNKFDYSSIEINLKGYSPAMVWMAQMQANRIIICHYKKSTITPLTLFALDGENLAKIPDPPNIDQYRSVSDLKFKAGSLIEEDGTVFLYLAIVFPTKISYLKFSLAPKLTDPPALNRSAHELFDNLGIDFTDSEMCFLKNTMFLVTQNITNTIDERRRETSAYLIDLDNPNLDYKFPLEKFDLQYLNEISVTCHTDTNIIRMSGVIDETDRRKTMNVYLNGKFDGAHNRVLQVLDDFNQQNCLVGFAKNFISEMCTGPNPSQNQSPRFYSRLISLNSNIVIYMKHQDQKKNYTVHLTAGSNNETFSVMALADGEDYNKTLDFNESFKTDYQRLIRNESRIQAETFSFHDKIYVKNEGHMLKVELKSNNESIKDLDGISIEERIVNHSYYKKNMSMDGGSDIKDDDHPSSPMIDYSSVRNNILALLTITTRYQNLSSWINIFEFNPTTMKKQKRIGRFEIQGQVCSMFDFDYFDTNTTVNETTNTDRHYVFLVMCNNGTRFQQMIYHYDNSTNKSISSLVKTTVSTTDKIEEYISIFQHKPSEISAWKTSSSDDSHEFKLTVTTPTRTFVTAVNCSNNSQSTTNTSLSSWKCEGSIPIHVPKDGVKAVDGGQLYYSYGFPFGEGEDKKYYLIQFTDSRALAVDVTGDSDGNKELPIQIPKSNKHNESAWELNTTGDGDVQSYARYWPNQFNCRPEKSYLRCVAISEDDDRLYSFVLYRDEKDGKNPIKMSNMIVHEIIPDCTGYETQVYVQDGFVALEDTLIGATDKKRLLMFYKIDKFDPNNPKHEADEYSKHKYVWYSIDKKVYFVDPLKQAHLFIFNAYNDGKPMQGMFINSDQTTTSLYLLEFKDRNLTLTVNESATSTALNSLAISFNYGQYKQINETKSNPDSVPNLWIILVAVGGALCLGLTTYLICCSIKAVRRPRQPTYIKNADHSITILDIDQSMRSHSNSIMG